MELKLDPERTRRWLSFVIAAGIAGLIVWMNLERPLSALPSVEWAAAFLFCVVQQDVARMKVPNAITFPAFALALGLASWQHGLAGLISGLAGAALVFGVLLVPFALRGLAAGDVKALMVLGALWGPGAAMAVLWWSAILGGALALAWVGARGELGDLLRRWGNSFGVTFATHRVTYFAAEPGATARRGVPRSVALALAVVALQVWGVPWGDL